MICNDMHVVDDDDDDDDDLKDDEKSLVFTNIHTGTLVDNMYRRTKVRLTTSHCLNERRILTLCLGW